MKKLCSVILLCLLALPLAGAAQEATFNWDVCTYGYETAAQLQGTEDVLEYNGSISVLNHEDTAQEGFVFLMVELYIKKTAAGGEGFAWENLFVEDQDGTLYSRMENDTFLEYYGYARLVGTTLRIGNHDGFIAFEVPDTIDTEAIRLVYITPEQELVIPLLEKPEEEE